MSQVRFNNSISLDGFTAGPDQSEENPLGVGGEQLHEWLLPLAAFRETHGDSGGEVNASSDVIRGYTENIGATVMGRNMFGGGPGPWGEEPWNGWWGDEPPFRMPVFVVTHHAREPLTLGETTFHFVTDGVESAIAQAKEAAGGQDVAVAGGAAVAREALAAGLVDQMQLSVVPVLLGAGESPLENLAAAGVKLEQLGAVDAPGVTHVTYRVSR